MFGLGIFQVAGIGLIALILSSGGAYIYGYEHGHSIAILEQQAANAKAIAKAAEDARALGIAEGTITFNVGKRIAEVQEKIVYRTITRIKEIPIYVTAKADAGCTIPVGFIRVLDDAATNRDPAESVPDASGQSVDAPSGVNLSRVAATVSENYSKFWQVREQLIGLQAWVMQQAVLHK